jgi:hypothetical protein
MNPFGVLKRTLFWSYARETWQYDVMCVLILAFIFLIPARVFDDPEAHSRRAGLGDETQRYVSAAEAPGGALDPSIAAAVGDEEIERIEIERNNDGTVRGYKIWSRRKTAGR